MQKPQHKKTAETMKSLPPLLFIRQIIAASALRLSHLIRVNRPSEWIL